MEAIGTELSENWWALGVRAAAAILFGVIALTVPAVTVTALVTLFGIYAIVDGCFAIVAAVRGVKRHERWGWMLFQGLIGLAAGAIAIFFPPIGAVALAWLVAAWALTTGVLEVASAIKLRKVIRGEWLLLLSGVLSIILAVMVAIFPGAGIVLLVWWVGAYALAYGLVILALAVRVRNWTRANA
jgi:uncharacterized membrane protein HdeD (DUF308 family)